MNEKKVNKRQQCKWTILDPKQKMFRFIILGIALTVSIWSCQTDPYGEKWVGDNTFTICQYLENNKDEYSKAYKLLNEGKMLSALCGYNPYGEDFTLFLPTNEALDQFILQSPDYSDFDQLLKDTGFIFRLSRYHILKKRVHTDQFPDGALYDSTFTGQRLAFAFYDDGDNQIIKVNDEVPIVIPNLKMSNGYIHVVSKVLQPVEISGYDWLQEQEGFSILAGAMEASRIKYSMWWHQYTILAEHDSVYQRKGINSVQDLIKRVGTPGKSASDKTNNFYKYVGYHFIGGEYYLNELRWGNHKYWTMGSKPLNIDVGYTIKINPGIDTYGIEISESGDTTVINYVRVDEHDYNNVTGTGPVHSIRDLLFFEPVPD